MDHSAHAARLFDENAELYVAKYMELGHYDASYAQLLPALPPKARVLDAACGPGTVARRLLAARPDLTLLGIDLAPRMIELARAAVPGARFEVGDCRALPGDDGTWDAIVCAFGLPYLSSAEAETFVTQAARRLRSGGQLYVSTQGGRPEDSGPQKSSRGDLVHVVFHPMEGPRGLAAWLTAAGLHVLHHAPLPCPENAPIQTSDWYCIARKPGDQS